MREINRIAGILAGCVVLAACGGNPEEEAGVADGGPSPSGPWSELDRRVSEFMAENSTPGSAYAVIENGDIVVSETAGFRCKGDDSPVAGDTFFRTMSLQRTLTAIAILEAAADSRVDLDSPIEGRLHSLGLTPECWAAQVTLRHLLTMTSGYPSGVDLTMGEAIWDPAGEWACTRSPDSLTMEERVAQLEGQHMGAPPGTWNMRNAYGHTVAAHYVEQVTTEPWESVLRAELFEPTGLERAHLELNEGFPSGYACGHRVSGGVASPVAPTQLCEAAYPRHAGFIDLTELARLAQILARGGLRPDGSRALHQSTIDALFSSDIPSWVSADARRSHAFVLWETEEVGTVALLHGGGWGYQVGMLIVPEERFAVVSLSNAVYSGADRPERGFPGLVLYDALELRFGVTVPPMWSPEPRSFSWEPAAADLRRLQGDYFTPAPMEPRQMTVRWHEEASCLHFDIETPEVELANLELRPALTDRFQLFGAGLGAKNGRFRARLWRDASGDPLAFYLWGTGLPYWSQEPPGCE